MERRIAYSLYKTGYTQFPAKDYDPETKTISVDLPEVPRHRMPKEWSRLSGGWYKVPAPNYCNVFCYNSGLAKNYLVEDLRGNCKTIPAGVDSFERMLSAVEKMGGEKL